MSDFARFRCWDPEGTQAILAPVVEAATDATFLATHLSLPVNAVEGPDVGRVGLTETDVLNTFLDSKSDPLVMAVVGPSGSGKSHLIKWLDVHLRADDRYVVVYVRREETNLRLVLQSILNQLPGEEPKRLLGEIRNATDKLTPALALANVNDFVVNRLEFEPPPLAREVEKQRQYLQKALPPLLRFDSVRSRMMSEGGIVHRNVQVTLHEWHSEDGPPPRFEPDDLRFQLPQGLDGRLPDASRRLYEALRNPAPDNDALRSTAAELLNQCLDLAVTDLLGLENSVSLTEVMTEARQLVRDGGRELILLIEDFALFDRIGGPLVDALVVPSREEDARPMARLRTAFAITSDPYDRLPETLRTRVANGMRYDTGMLVGDDGIEFDRLVDFVGNYLNAVRIGREQLHEAWAGAEGPDRLSGTWIGNPCDRCPHDEACRSGDGFGRSSLGHGLYPLNRAAISKLAEASLEHERFVPRTLLAQVLAPVLEAGAQEIELGAFPSPGFERRAQSLPNSASLTAPKASVAHELEQRRDPDAKRRLRALQFWHSGPVTTLFDLHPSIHEAFDLPILGDVEPEPEDSRTREQPRNAADGRTKEQERADRQVESIDLWLSNPESSLAPDVANDIRKFLHQQVLLQMRLNDELLSPSLQEISDGGSLFDHTSFVIERASVRGPSPGSVRIDLTATPENAVLLQAAIRLNSGMDVAGADDYFSIVQRTAEWAPDVLVRCHDATAKVTGEFPLEAAIHALIICAWVDGDVDPAAFTDPLAAVHAALAPITDALPQGEAAPAWARFSAIAATSERGIVRERLIAWVQAAQGATGDVQAVDVTRLVHAATPLLVGAQAIPAGSACPGELRELSRRTSAIAEAAEDEAKRLLDVISTTPHELVARHTAVADQLANVTREAAKAGVFEPHQAKESFERQCAEVSVWDMSEASNLVDLQDGLQSEALTSRLAAIQVARPPCGLATKFNRFLETAASYLDQSRIAADAEMFRVFPESTPADARASIVDAVKAAATLLDGLSEELDRE